MVYGRGDEDLGCRVDAVKPETWKPNLQHLDRLKSRQEFVGGLGRGDLGFKIALFSPVTPYSRHT